MKPLQSSISVALVISFAAISLFVIVITIFQSDTGNSSSEYYTEKTENTMMPISEAPSCVTRIKNQTIFSGALGDFSCTASEFYTQTKILKTSGFYGVYHNSTNDRSDTYALEPGRLGTITYVISGHAIRYEGSPPPGFVIKDHLSLSNDVLYIHHQTVTVPQTVRISHYGPNGTDLHYWACYKTPIDEQYGGQECYESSETVPADNITLDAMLYSHPGINVTYSPQSEMIQNNGPVSVTATISAASDAPTGTYWIILSPGQCNGGQILLLAVTKCNDIK